jgi:HK97 family phage major capsid protein
MPAYGTDNHPIAFGNWRRGYLIADRSDVRITVDDNVTTPGYVKFYVRKRLGGCVLNHQTLRLLKVSDS